MAVSTLDLGPQYNFKVIKMEAPKQMSGQAGSMFRMISIGTSKENKPRGSTLLNVLMNEKAMATDGEIMFNPTEQTRQWQDTTGETHQVKTTAERSVPCQWLPSEDNRATPPDIMRNELVEVWRLGDSDKYYWRSLALKNGLRSLESVVYTWNASPNPGGGGVDFATCYYLAVSAHDKHFTIGTSKANGEPYAWTMQFNTGEGEFTITDDIGNEFEIVSKDNRLQLKNPDGTYLKLERKIIEMKADESIELIVGGTRYKLVPTAVTTTTTDVTTDASTFTVNAPKVSIGGGNVTLRTPSGFAIVG